MEPMPPSPGGGGRLAARVARDAARSAVLLCALCAHVAHAQRVRVTNLSDVDFGVIANPQADARRSQNLCVFSNSTAGAYSVSASGSGAGAGFLLSNGSATLAYDVEWSDRSGQGSGAQLGPAVPLTGQRSSATHQFCNSGPATSASLTIVLRGAELSRAFEGNYTGTLTLLIAAE